MADFLVDYSAFIASGMAYRTDHNYSMQVLDIASAVDNKVRANTSAAGNVCRNDDHW
jgi:hypothetical protein